MGCDPLVSVVVVAVFFGSTFSADFSSTFGADFCSGCFSGCFSGLFKTGVSFLVTLDYDTFKEFFGNKK